MKVQKDVIRGGYISATNRNYISLMNKQNGDSINSDPLILIKKEKHTPSPSHYKLKITNDWSHRSSITGLGAAWPKSQRECLSTFIKQHHFTNNKQALKRNAHSTSTELLQSTQDRTSTDISNINHCVFLFSFASSVSNCCLYS